MIAKSDDDRTGGHRRALRAARAATLGLALAGGGCYLQHDTPPGAERDVMAGDAARPSVDAGASGDGGLSDGNVDARPTDARWADAGTCLRDGNWGECCEAHDWDPRWGCAAWGPYVPPAEGALPPSRSAMRQGRA